jgi:hypothetical protein
MSIPQKHYSGGATATNVIQFPGAGRMSRTTASETFGSQDVIPPGIGDASVFAERVAQLLTVRMAELMVAQASSQVSQWNPYDAIFLSKLKPDRFEVPSALKKAITIEDRSGQISFNDGWDD